jgi:pimeloyl-ACP methyl ester carboxylesterase
LVYESQQLAPVADQLTGEVIADSGHLVPLDRPDAVAEHLLADVPRAR